MKQNNKYGFYVIISLIILTLFNLIFFSKKNKNSGHIKREHYKQTAAKFNGAEFPIIKIKNVISDEIIDTKVSKGFIILLSNAGCNPCQVRELKNLEKLYRQYSDKLTVYAIYFVNYERMEALRLKKVSTISFPIFYTDEEIQDSPYSTNPFPKIFFISNQEILSTLIPIPEDDLFSTKFFDYISAKYLR